MDVSTALHLAIDLLPLSLVIDRRVVAALNHGVGDTLVLVLVWIDVY